MSNVRDRFGLTETYRENGEKKRNCSTPREFSQANGNVGRSIAYTAYVYNNFLYPDEAKKGDFIYFKANSQIGINKNGRGVIDEARGSCEDVAEVLAYYILDELNKKRQGQALIQPTPYFFAEFESEFFGEIVHKQTGGLIDLFKLYGCASRDIAKNGTIVHGRDILKQILPSNEVFLSRNNTINNFNLGLQKFSEETGVIVDPSIPRRLFNLMFFDYFYCNSDRHCQNINFEIVKDPKGKDIIILTPILDNGGGMLMQNLNYASFIEDQYELIQQNGEITKTKDGLSTSIKVQYELTCGKEIFGDEVDKNQFNKLEYEEQLLSCLAYNHTLFDDFKFMYENLDLKEPLKRLRSHTSTYFIPELDVVLNSALTFKKKEICMTIAKMLNIPFDDAKFKNDNNYYLDTFESVVVKGNGLNIPISSDEEIESFSEKHGLQKFLGDAQQPE